MGWFGDSAVVKSALQALNESDALCVVSWHKLEALIRQNENSEQMCKCIVEMRQKDLPTEIQQLWLYLDDLTERSNRRAEHFEVLAKRPAPPSEARAESDRIMDWIRLGARIANNK
jgi:hypothetical protein